MIKLDGRLTTIADMVPKCRSFADIGADHGLLSAYLLEKGICQRAQLVDISEPSLRKAGKLISRLGLDDRAIMAVGDGATPLAYRPDCAVIAGMGGDTIAHIVANGMDKLGGSFVITQPNVGIYDLRRRLSSMGWSIEDERLAHAAGRWYVIIAWRMSKDVEYSDVQLMAGPMLLKRGGDEMRDYVKGRIAIALKALAVDRDGLDGPTMAMRRELELWREAEKCL